jgi:hypothetical protein
MVEVGLIFPGDSGIVENLARKVAKPRKGTCFAPTSVARARSGARAFQFLRTDIIRNSHSDESSRVGNLSLEYQNNSLASRKKKLQQNERSDKNKSSTSPVFLFIEKYFGKYYCKIN